MQLSNGALAFRINSLGQALFGAGTSNISANSFTSTSSNPAATGVLRCASSDLCLAFRNNANTNDVTLGKNTSDVFTFNNTTGFAVTQVGATTATTLSFPAPAANQTLSVPDSGLASDTFALLSAAQTFAKKTVSDGLIFVAQGSAPANPPATS